MRSVVSALSRGAVLAGAIAVGACGGDDGSTSTTGTTAAATSAPTTSTPAIPGGGAMSTPPGGGDGSSAGSASITPLGTVVVDGSAETRASETITASVGDTSGVLVVNGGAVTLTDVDVSTTGDSSSTDESSFYGLNAGVLATTGSTISMVGGSVATTGVGANGVFAYGDGTVVTIQGTTVEAHGAAGHGIMASGGGSITATDLQVVTTSTNAAAIATDRGGGTITVTGGRYSTAGADSPGLYSTGTLDVTGTTVAATGAEVAVIEGSNSIAVRDCSLTGTKKRGVMIYQSMSGDASGSNGAITITGGSLAQVEGPLLFVTNATGTITLEGVDVDAESGTLLEAAAADWGSSGANGGIATVVATVQTLTGDVVVDAISEAAISLADGSQLAGGIDTAVTAKRVSLALDATSSWTVTADSHLTVLDDSAGIEGTTVTNIVGNGHTVRYDAASNELLGGLTYTLAGGGTLEPA